MSGMLFNWAMILMYVALNSTGALLIKNKINVMGAANFSSLAAFIHYFARLLSSWQVLAGFVAIFISAIAWMIALSRIELSVAYPIAVGLNFLLIVGFSLILFGEPLTTNKVVGVLLLLTGLFFMTRA